MDELALHVLDIVENSLAAGADRIRIAVDEDRRHNRLVIRIRDNGRGMSARALKRSMDPFYTTKTVRRIGLGLSLMAQACRAAGGRLDVRSTRGRGTSVRAEFVFDHIDRQPLGNMALTVVNIMAAGGAGVDIAYEHKIARRVFRFDTRAVRKIVPPETWRQPAVLNALCKRIEQALKSIS